MGRGGSAQWGRLVQFLGLALLRAFYSIAERFTHCPGWVCVDERAFSADAVDACIAHHQPGTSRDKYWCLLTT